MPVGFLCWWQDVTTTSHPHPHPCHYPPTLNPLRQRTKQGKAWKRTKTQQWGESNKPTSWKKWLQTPRSVCLLAAFDLVPHLQERFIAWDEAVSPALSLISLTLKFPSSVKNSLLPIARTIMFKCRDEVSDLAKELGHRQRSLWVIFNHSNSHREETHFLHEQAKWKGQGWDQMRNTGLEEPGVVLNWYRRKLA